MSILRHEFQDFPVDGFQILYFSKLQYTDPSRLIVSFSILLVKYPNTGKIGAILQDMNKVTFLEPEQKVFHV